MRKEEEIFVCVEAAKTEAKELARSKQARFEGALH